MKEDPFVEFKTRQRDAWKHFAPMEALTTLVAAHTVRFAGVRAGDRVLDVGTGTGVVALTARATGANVTGIDLTPELLARARENAAIATLEDITWKEGDVEALPFPDEAFDVVVSQFAHMFAPRPEVAIGEMVRVLRSGGRIAFSTWPPDQFVGRMFALVAKYLPPPLEPRAAPPAQWGDPAVVEQRLRGSTKDIFFERGVMNYPALSPQHYRDNLERTSGQVIQLLNANRAQPEKLAAFRREVEELVTPYLRDNVVRQEYLLTRATKL